MTAAACVPGARARHAADGCRRPTPRPAGLARPRPCLNRNPETNATSSVRRHNTTAADSPPRPRPVRKEPPMLVLSRQRDESIIIGDNIVVTIVDIRGDKVRLGINAPTEIPVHRQEIYEAIQRENLRASRVEPKDTQGLGRPNIAPKGKSPERS